MGFNPFIGKSQAWLEAELAKAQDDLAAGGSIDATGTGSVNSSQNLQIGIMERIELLLRALHILDAVTYPEDGIERTTTTLYQAPSRGF